MARDGGEDSIQSRRDESPQKSSTQITMASTPDDNVSERSPLLRPQTERAKSQNGHVPKLHSTRSILLVLALVILLTSFGQQLQESPQTRIFESIICYRYYETHDPSKIRIPRNLVGPGAIHGVDEMWCKAPKIQDDLARIDGYADFFDGFPFLLLAVPFGWAADRFGRWPFLFMNLAQFAVRAGWTQIVAWNWQAIDVRAVWANSAFAVLGGGDPVASSLFFVAIADVTPDEERAAAFLRVGAANLSANLFMPPLAAWLMQINPWIPFMAGTVMLILATLLFFMVPETLNFRHQLVQTKTPAAEEVTAAPPDVAPTQQFGFVTVAQRWYVGSKSSLSFLVDDWRLPALISTFVGHLLILKLTKLVLQYLSSRYSLTFSQATLLVTIRNGVIVLLLFSILPYLSALIMRVYGLCGRRKDLYLARASQSLMAIGWLLVSFAPNIPVVTISMAIASLGHGAPLLIRSLLTSLLPPHRIATVYCLISITDTVGNMFGSPLLAGLFARGLALGGIWTGLPFLFVATLLALFAGLLFAVQLKKGEGDNSDIDQE